MAGPGSKLVDLAVAGALKRGLRQGLGAGSNTWLVIGTVAVSVRLLQRLGRPGPGTSIQEELLPGQTLVITHLAND